MNLAEYRQKPKMLADFLPWAALVAPGVVLNKDGSFQRTARFRGPDLDSATAGRARRHHRAAQQRVAPARLRLGDLRRGKPHCGTALSAEPVSRSGLEPRRCRAPSAIRGSGSAFRERVLPDLPLVAAEPKRPLVPKAGSTRGDPDKTRIDAHELLNGFIDRTDRVLQLVEGFMPEVRVALRRRDADLSAFDDLDQASSRARARNADASRRAPGRRTAHGRARAAARQRASAGFSRSSAFRPRPFPGFSTSSIGSHFPIAGPPGRSASTRPTRRGCSSRIRRQWFAKRKSIMAILKEVMTNEASALLDTDAHNKALDADAALQELGSDAVGHGLCDRHCDGLGRRARQSPTRSCGWSRRSSRAATSPASPRRSTRSKPGSGACPAMSTPMSASRRSRPSTSPT